MKTYLIYCFISFEFIYDIINAILIIVTNVANPIKITILSILIIECNFLFYFIKYLNSSKITSIVTFYLLFVSLTSFMSIWLSKDINTSSELSKKAFVMFSVRIPIFSIFALAISNVVEQLSISKPSTV